MWAASRRIVVAALVGASCTLLRPASAAADETPAASADARRVAARKFAQGTHDFDAGDFTRAADEFEAAYQAIPHEDSLWNAARSRHRAGELARAANLYARYLRVALPAAPDRAAATASLLTLAKKLARIDVHLGAGASEARVDDVPLDGETVYVVPGAHSVTARSTRGPIEQRADVAAGGAVSVLLAPPPEPSVAPEPAPPPPPPPPAPHRAVEPPPETPPPAHHGLPPLAVIVEGGVTLAVAGVTLWSALDTVSTAHDFEAKPTQSDLDHGRSAEIRTNVLLGVALGLGAVTAVTAVFFVDWRSSPSSLEVGLGPGGLIGRFR